MDVLKVAIIGIGNMGSAHALCISNGEIEGLCLCAVCDVEARKLNTFAEKYPDVYFSIVSGNINNSGGEGTMVSRIKTKYFTSPCYI